MSAYGNDCHFYYNSTCTKGDNCAFRHSEAAKNCTITCTFWRQGICSKPNCPYRHAEIQNLIPDRNRQAIPCYWENQPQGCARPNCQYQHFKPRPVLTQPVISETQLPDTSVPPPLFGQSQQPPVSELYVPGVPIVQPVVVQFSDSEVESDKNSPVKGKNVLDQVPAIARKNLQTFDQSQPVSKAEVPSATAHVVTQISQQPNTTFQTVVPQNTQAQQASTTFQVVVPTGTQSNPIVVRPSAAIPEVTKAPKAIPELDYFIGRPFLQNKSDSPVRSPRYGISPDRRSYDSRYSRSPSPDDRSLSPWRRRSRSPSPRRSRSPRRRSPYSRDRSRSLKRWSPRRSPSPRRRTPPRNAIYRPQDRYLQSRRPVHERLNRNRDYPSTSSGRDRQPAVSPKKISLSKIKDKTDSEDDKIKVKSLEEIQRAKALLSMGLIELKSGKIVKIGDVNKYKEQENEKDKEEPPKKKKLFKKSTTKSKKTEKKVRPKSKKAEKMEEKKEVVEERPEENLKTDVSDGQEEEEFEEGDDLGEEPEIDICEAPEGFEEEDSQDQEESEDGVEVSQDEDEEEEEEEEPEQETSSESEPEPVQPIQDIRRAVRKEDVEKKSPPQLKKKRKVIVDEGKQERTTSADLKSSVHSRLGRKLNSIDAKTNKQDSSTRVKVDCDQSSKVRHSVKSRLHVKQDNSDEQIGSSNEGTVKFSSGGIKSRLGIGGNVSSSVNTNTTNTEPKKIVLKRTIQTDKQEDKEEKKEVVKKRRWNQGSVKSRLGISSSETSINDSDLKKIVIVRNVTDDDENSQNKLQKDKLNLKWDPLYKPESGQDNEKKSASEENKTQIKNTLSRINRIIENKKESKEQGVEMKGLNKLNIWSSRVSESIAAAAPKKKESEIDMFDSSSNDSLPMESRTSLKETKPSKRGPKQERALYVPPARKRTVTSYDDQEENSQSPPKKTHKKHKEKKAEPESIKTYSQIMEEKRKKLEKQREKKAKSEEKTKKKITSIVFSDKENETVPENTNDMPTEQKHISPLKTEVPVAKSNLLDSFSFSLPDSTEKPSQSDHVDSSNEHMELLSAIEPDSSKQETSKSAENPPAKKTSDDSWLDFTKEDLDMTVGDTADDDDLLREIDELLA